MAKKKEMKKEKKDDKYAAVVPAFLLIGVGVDFLLGKLPAFTLIGLGVGFLILFLVRAFVKK
jgi:hypothetical protein